MKLLIFFLIFFSIFVGHFALLDPDTDPLTRLNPDPIRIRIRNTARNPDEIILYRIHNKGNLFMIIKKIAERGEILNSWYSLPGTAGGEGSGRGLPEREDGVLQEEAGRGDGGDAQEDPGAPGPHRQGQLLGFHSFYFQGLVRPFQNEPDLFLCTCQNPT